MNNPKTAADKLVDFYNKKSYEERKILSSDRGPCGLCGAEIMLHFEICENCQREIDLAEKEAIKNEFDGYDEEDARKWADAERWLDDPDNYRTSNSGDDL